MFAKIGFGRELAFDRVNDKASAHVTDSCDIVGYHFHLLWGVVDRQTQSIELVAQPTPQHWINFSIGDSCNPKSKAGCRWRWIESVGGDSLVVCINDEVGNYWYNT
ncbi:unnamed protein product [Phytophthora fragariaefolia]|uniref:Unnamed protein product n=1 Tax=Phytophthora fragariaefolia TaxID=1490495 RepID=A0A9W6TJQ4_9STRA|nr:unnamed protein product [Phytophthora fragariaefolia]